MTGQLNKKIRKRMKTESLKKIVDDLYERGESEEAINAAVMQLDLVKHEKQKAASTPKAVISSTWIWVAALLFGCGLYGVAIQRFFPVELPPLTYILISTALFFGVLVNTVI
ncbi:MAG: hypothetical protein ABIH34_00285 [Nanoarchaeota archaeon]